jgi:tRNA (guanine-N7-)-methyltransferase
MTDVANNKVDAVRVKPYDTAPGVISVTAHEYPVLPDAALQDPEAGRLDPRRWFTHPERPLEIEIGTGKGAFIVSQSAADPETNYLGIEWEGEIHAYCADRLRRRGARNVRMLHTNAVDFLRWRMPSGMVRVIHLYFSDPWPKFKHHKNRVIQDGFLAQAWRVLMPGGELRVVTDHDELWEWDRTFFDRWCSKSGAGVPAEIRAAAGGAPFSEKPFTSPMWAEDGELLGTNYERKFKRDDRLAHATVLVKHVGGAV